MVTKLLRGIIERPWLRIGLAVAMLIVGLAPVGAPILSDNSLRQALRADGAANAAPAYIYRYDNSAGGTSQIQRSQSGSRNWADVAVISASLLQISPATSTSDKLVFARSQNDIWRSQDAGATWTKAQALPSRPLTMAVAPERDQFLVAGTSTNGLLVSSDQGQTWRPAGGPLTVTGPGSLAVNAVALNPADSQVIYASTDSAVATPTGLHQTAGMFVSVDGARHWFQMQAAAGNAGAIGKAANALQPVANHPLDVTALGQAGVVTYRLGATSDLLAALHDADPGLRAAAAKALGLTGDAAAAQPLLAQLRDADQAAGDRAAEALGRLGDASVVPALTQALNDRDEAVRARSARALGLLKDNAAVGALANMLQHDGPLARGSAADGLAAIGTPEAVAALMAPLADDQLTSARQLAMTGLESLGNTAVPQLAGALRSGDGVVRRNAAETLGYIRADATVPALAEAVADRDPAVRLQAAWALGEIGTVPAQQALAHEMAVEKDEAVRQAAMQALTQAQAMHAERAEVTRSPLAALLAAVTQVPASRWTLMLLGVLLAAVLLTVRPRAARQRA